MSHESVYSKKIIIPCVSSYHGNSHIIFQNARASRGLQPLSLHEGLYPFEPCWGFHTPTPAKTILYHYQSCVSEACINWNALKKGPTDILSGHCLKIVSYWKQERFLFQIVFTPINRHASSMKVHYNKWENFSKGLFFESSPLKEAKSNLRGLLLLLLLLFNFYFNFICSFIYLFCFVLFCYY